MFPLRTQLSSCSTSSTVKVTHYRGTDIAAGEAPLLRIALVRCADPSAERVSESPLVIFAQQHPKLRSRWNRAGRLSAAPEQLTTACFGASQTLTLFSAESPAPTGTGAPKAG